MVTKKKYLYKGRYNAKMKGVGEVAQGQIVEVDYEINNLNFEEIKKEEPKVPPPKEEKQPKPKKEKGD